MATPVFWVSYDDGDDNGESGVVDQRHSVVAVDVFELTRGKAVWSTRIGRRLTKGVARKDALWTQ